MYPSEKKKEKPRINNQKKTELPCSGGGKPTAANSTIPPSAAPWKKQRNKKTKPTNKSIRSCFITHYCSRDDYG